MKQDVEAKGCDGFAKRTLLLSWLYDYEAEGQQSCKRQLHGPTKWATRIQLHESEIRTARQSRTLSEWPH